MTDEDGLAAQFEEYRGHLRSVAYRMLGSLTEADDAVQEAWFRLHRADTAEVGNLGGWLTTVVARVCLDMLRSRTSRREQPFGEHQPEPPGQAADPEHEAVLADSVGLAMLVVLEALNPSERLAFVLHDMFAVPFDDIAPILGRTPTATRQLASRARRRVQGTATVPEPDLARQRAVVDAFLAASRGGDMRTLISLLHPDVVLHSDQGGVTRQGPAELHGAEAVAANFKGRAALARSALVDGAVGVVVAPRGELLLAMRLRFDGDRIRDLEVIGDREALAGVELGVLAD